MSIQSRRSLRPDAGVTLMELMIAVSLVSLLSVGMLMAIRVGLNAMQKTNARFIENRRAMSLQRIIDSQVGGVMPVVSECHGGGGKFVFFEGHPTSMRFVSAYSLQEASRGYPRILSFEVLPASEGVRLIVNELVYPGPVAAGFLCGGVSNGIPSLQSSGPNPQSFVLADKLAYCRILYRRTMPPPDLESWLPEWNIPDRLPSGIRIEMAPVHPEPTQLKAMTVSAPLHVSKWVLGPYADE